jgi:hypothetical protein
MSKIISIHSYRGAQENRTLQPISHAYCFSVVTGLGGDVDIQLLGIRVIVQVKLILRFLFEII